MGYIRFNMPKKEEIGYGIVILFVLVSLFLIILMVPFDTVTGAAVLDYSNNDLKSFFFRAPVIDLIVLVIVGTLIIGGSMEIMNQKKEAEELLETLPRTSRIELKEYARESLENGFKKEDVKEALVAEGWSNEIVDAVLRLY